MNPMIMQSSVVPAMNGFQTTPTVSLSRLIEFRNSEDIPRVDSFGRFVAPKDRYGAEDRDRVVRESDPTALRQTSSSG